MIVADIFKVIAGDVLVDSAGFNGNLSPTDDTVQKCLQKLDDLTVTNGGRKWILY